MALLGLLLILCTPFGTAIPLSSFYPFGSSAGDTGLGPIDDGSSAAISLPTSVSFYGTSYTSIFVSSFSACMNGNYYSYEPSMYSVGHADQS